MQSNRKIQRRNTRTKTIMIDFNSQTETTSTQTAINSYGTIDINHDSVTLLETDISEATSNEHTKSTNVNINNKIQISERQYDFQKMRALFEKSSEETKQLGFSTVKVKTGKDIKEKKIRSNQDTNKIEKEIRTDKKEKEKKIRSNQDTNKIEKDIKFKSTVQSNDTKGKSTEKIKNHVYNHNSETASDENNDTDKKLRMFKFDHLINLWKDRNKKN